MPDCARPENVPATPAEPRFLGRARPHGRVVGAKHDVGVEHRQERVEVAATGRREEGLDDLPPSRQIDLGNRAGPLYAAWLASCLAAAGDRPTMGAISSNGRTSAGAS